jgi:hypothetical protein
MGATYLNFNLMTTFIEMQNLITSKLTKGEIMIMNFESMATMGSYFSFAFKVHDGFLLR